MLLIQQLYGEGKKDEKEEKRSRRRKNGEEGIKGKKGKKERNCEYEECKKERKQNKLTNSWECRSLSCRSSKTGTVSRWQRPVTGLDLQFRDPFNFTSLFLHTFSGFTSANCV